MQFSADCITCSAVCSLMLPKKAKGMCFQGNWVHCMYCVYTHKCFWVVHLGSLTKRSSFSSTCWWSRKPISLKTSKSSFPVTKIDGYCLSLLYSQCWREYLRVHSSGQRVALQSSVTVLCTPSVLHKPWYLSHVQGIVNTAYIPFWH